MSNDISYEAKQTQQLHSEQVEIGVAHEPENTVRTRHNIPAALEINSEYPIRFTPRVEVYLGAICNTVNDVVEAHPIVTDPLDNPISLLRPLSRAKVGIAIEPMEKLYEFLSDITQHNYLLLAADDAAIHDRLTTTVESIHAQLLEHFGGDPLEQEGMEFSIARRDFFTTTVSFEVVETTVGLQTVNDIQLIVSVYIHAGSLTSLKTDIAEMANTVKTQYRTVIRNFARASGIDTQLSVVFDASNFSVRPSVLNLFNALIQISEGKVAVVQNETHLPDEANIVVSLDINSKG
jgi:hypothetical protein